MKKILGIMVLGYRVIWDKTTNKLPTFLGSVTDKKKENHKINQQTRLQTRLFRDKSICKERQIWLNISYYEQCFIQTKTFSR